MVDDYDVLQLAALTAHLATLAAKHQRCCVAAIQEGLWHEVCPGEERMNTQPKSMALNNTTTLVTKN